MGETYLITGGHGFIGKHLARALLAEGHAVRILDNLSSITDEPLPEGCELIVGDVAEAATVAECMAGVTGCYHLAAVASVEQCTQEWGASHRVNVGGTVNVLDAARAEGGLPVVYASSAAIYGAVKTVPVHETAEISPISAYGADKYGSELHARVAAEIFGVPTAGMRFFNVYGPGQNAGSPYSGVITLFADRLHRGAPLCVHGDGKQSRDFIYVGDVVRFCMAAMGKAQVDRAAGTAQADIFNVATGKATSLLELIQTMQSLFGSPSEMTFGPARRGDIRHSLGDAAHAEATLGVAANTSLHEGLAALHASLVPGSAHRTAAE